MEAITEAIMEDTIVDMVDTADTMGPDTTLHTPDHILTSLPKPVTMSQ
eukprot:CAMPEP_0197004444 /NCGR_PEP_ID=MMETSP1380-20130617/22824_1 /TAXON_ID=5936 /ORGANISM="Euplotes crassus, Strain CT5" /LENGTH=47 /DNA_ID= /DNA_START= /DNA_END= /DNA_ORIENTATION=